MEQAQKKLLLEEFDGATINWDTAWNLWRESAKQNKNNDSIETLKALNLLHEAEEVLCKIKKTLHGNDWKSFIESKSFHQPFKEACYWVSKVEDVLLKDPLYKENCRVMLKGWSPVALISDVPTEAATIMRETLKEVIAAALKRAKKSMLELGRNGTCFLESTPLWDISKLPDAGVWEHNPWGDGEESSWIADENEEYKFGVVGILLGADNYINLAILRDCFFEEMQKWQDSIIENDELLDEESQDLMDSSSVDLFIEPPVPNPLEALKRAVLYKWNACFNDAAQAELSSGERTRHILIETGFIKDNNDRNSLLEAVHVTVSKLNEKSKMIEQVEYDLNNLTTLKIDILDLLEPFTGLADERVSWTVKTTKFTNNQKNMWDYNDYIQSTSIH